MNWFYQLLGVDTPPGTRLVAAEFDLRGQLAYWLVGLLVVCFAAFAGLLYAKENARLMGWLRRGALALLRTALLTLLLLLLLRPIVLAEFAGERARSVVLLVDNSQSMEQADRRLSPADKIRLAIALGKLPVDASIQETAQLGGAGELPKDPQRIALVRSVLADPQRKLLDGLKTIGTLRPYAFGTHLRSVLEDPEGTKATGKDGKPTTPSEQLANLLCKTTDSKTGLADAVLEILQRRDGDLPAAIVIATDGRDNASKLTLQEAARECFRAKVPLYVYGVGSTEGGTLQLREMTAPETIFYDDEIAVPLRWRSQGFKKARLQMVLNAGGKIVDGKLVGGRTVDEKEIDVRNGDDVREFLTYKPQKHKDLDEKTNLIAVVRIKGDDTYQDMLSRPVRLSDNKVRILYVESSPRWEYKFLQPALLRDRRVHADFILVNGDPKLMQSGRPFLANFPTREELLKYDLVILGDVPESYLNKERCEWLKEYVGKFKGGLIAIAGRQHMPADYAGKELEEMLPVEFEPTKFKLDETKRTEEYQPQLIDAGVNTEMLYLADTDKESRKVWASLVGFHWHYPIKKLRPGASALAVHPRDKIMVNNKEQPMPLFAWQYYGKGQVLFLGTDETWRWRYNSEDKHFVRFWGQVIYQMAMPHMLGGSSNKAQFALEHSEAIKDRPSSLYVRLLTDKFEPIKDKEVSADLFSLSPKGEVEGKRTVKLYPIAANRPGEYRLLLENDKEGSYELRLKGMEQPYQYRVQLPPRHEKEEANLAEDALRDAAQLSGGRFYREEDLGHMLADIKPNRIPFTLRQEILLWNPLTFLLIVGLLTAEWLVRKFSDLS